MINLQTGARRKTSPLSSKIGLKQKDKGRDEGKGTIMIIKRNPSLRASRSNIYMIGGKLATTWNSDGGLRN